MIPIGVPMKTPMMVMMRLPTIGFSRPPALPGGGVISVKTAALRPLKPFQNSAPRMSASMARPTRGGDERQRHPDLADFGALL